MIPSGQKTSLLIPSQLPGFIRDNPDYQNFVLFLQTYYEWMEQNGGVTENSKNLLSYKDIDNTTNQFINYFINDFLPYFPEDALIDKSRAVKLARQLYQSKGTLASYQFLFKILYNSDFDIFYTKDAVLKASNGNWYVPKSLKVVYENIENRGEIDNDFLNVSNYRIFGETTKSIATIENSVISGNKIEIFISNIERLFQSGETVRLVDSNNQDVLDEDGGSIRGKIVGQISQINIDPNNRGLFYQPGDPVVVYNGLSTPTSIGGATAVVGSTTKGSIQRIIVTNGGYGYRENPNTVILITNAPGASAAVGTLNPNPAKTANVSFIPSDSISVAQYTSIGSASYLFFSNNISANVNTTLANAFSFLSFSTYPIETVYVTNGGGGISTLPQITALTEYSDSLGDIGYLSSLGILAPIQIISAGTGYRENDQIVITGGTGYGAYANVTSVAANGSITTVSYVYPPADTPHHYPLGGMGYNAAFLPSATVNSANVAANGAILSVPGILGSGAEFSIVTDRTGSITSINLIDNGEDYIATPNISLNVLDVVVSGISLSDVPKKEDIIYQGSTLNTASFQASVDSIYLLEPFSDPATSIYSIRLYNYNSLPNPSLPLKIYEKDISLTMSNFAFNSNYNANGIRIYGDGTAKASTTYLNGLVIGQGQYLNTQGQPSGYDVLQSTDYNNYTYKITVQKEISKYRDILLNLLHPAGMKLLGRYALVSNNQFNSTSSESLATGLPLNHYTGTPASSVTMTTDFNTLSDNTLTFSNLAGADITSFIFTGIEGVANSIVQIIPPHGPKIRSEVIGITSNNDDLINDLVSSEDLLTEASSTEDLMLIPGNTITLKDKTWLTFPNVAVIKANTGSHAINITSMTGSYDIINNGNYSNPAKPLMDIVFAGDSVQLAGNAIHTVASVDYVNNIIYTTGIITSNVSSGLLSVKRTFSASGSQITIFGQIGLEYYPELTTENDLSLTTEDGSIIILG